MMPCSTYGTDVDLKMVVGVCDVICIHMAQARYWLRAGVYTVMNFRPPLNKEIV